MSRVYMPKSPDALRTTLAQNVDRVRQCIAAGCRRSGRAATDVRLIAVTKYVGPELIESLLAIGVKDIGESRVGQLVDRAGVLGERPGLIWHMIGHLQRNKVKPLLAHAGMIHSLDSVRLAEEIQRRAAAFGRTADVLIEVNISGESSKTGLAYDQTAALADALGGRANLRVRGLMTMAPRTVEPERVRPCFAALRELLALLRGRGVVSPECRHLSMGMSGDFRVAVEEGATMVRVGSALFDGLQAYKLQRDPAEKRHGAP